MDADKLKERLNQTNKYTQFLKVILNYCDLTSIDFSEFDIELHAAYSIELYDNCIPTLKIDGLQYYMSSLEDRFFFDKYKQNHVKIFCIENDKTAGLSLQATLKQFKYITIHSSEHGHLFNIYYIDTYDRN